MTLFNKLNRQCFSSLFSMLTQVLKFYYFGLLHFQNWKNSPTLFFVVFMFLGISINKQAHIANGNIRNKSGYKYFYWNCARAFLSKDKIEDIRLLVQTQNIHILGISEVDICSDKYTYEQIERMFSIENYNIILPNSWKRHGLARILVYVKNDIEVKIVEDRPEDDDLQHILLEVGLGKNKHMVDLYYREWKSCVTGNNNPNTMLITSRD